MLEKHKRKPIIADRLINGRGLGFPHGPGRQDLVTELAGGRLAAAPKTLVVHTSENV